MGASRDVLQLAGAVSKPILKGASFSDETKKKSEILISPQIKSRADCLPRPYLRNSSSGPSSYQLTLVREGEREGGREG